MQPKPKPFPRRQHPQPMNLPYIPGECDYCGRAFLGRRPNRRWCSPSCRQLASVARKRQAEARAALPA